jgi:glycosyltransferase XagB
MSDALPYPSKPEEGGWNHATKQFESMFPPEIAFLARYGVPDTVLAEIIRFEGQRLDEVAIRNGFVSEEFYYRALAAETGLPFVTNLEALELVGDLECLQTLLARTSYRSPRAVAAPIGARLSYVVRCDPAQLAGLVITTPSRLKAQLRHNLRSGRVAYAATALMKIRPSLSAYGGLWLGQIVVMMAITPFFSFFMTLEPLITTVVTGLIVAPFFLFNTVARLSAVYQRGTPVRQPVRLNDSELPVYTVIVPLYHEARIVPHLIASLSALDYPRTALDIKIVIEETDIETRSALRKHGIPAYMDVIVAPEGFPQTKPRALDIALLEARGVFVTIYDAEDIPEPQQLRLAASHFAILPPQIGCLQAELRIDNGTDALISRLFALEYAGLFKVANPGLEAMGIPFLLGGTSNHFRTDVLRQIGGWDAWNLTEDADIGCRLVANGYRLSCFDSVTQEEAPVTLYAWFKQRVRWMKGFTQTAITLTREPIRVGCQMGWITYFIVLCLTFGTVISALCFPLAFVGVLYLSVHYALYLDEPPLVIAFLVLSQGFFLCGLAAMIIPAWVGAKRAGIGHWRLWSLMMPVYALGVSLASWVSIFELVRRPFYWNKTEHGVSKTRYEVKSP